MKILYFWSSAATTVKGKPNNNCLRHTSKYLWANT